MLIHKLSNKITNNLILSLLLLFLLIIPFSDARIINIILEYNNGFFILNRTSSYDINLPGGRKLNSDYIYKIYDINGNILSQDYVIFPQDFNFEIDLPENTVQLVTLNVIQYPKVKNLIIYDKSVIPVVDIDLMQYNRCNLNNICDTNENSLVCPEDCFDSLKDGVCQNIEDDICNNDADCTSKDPDCILQEAKNIGYSENQELNSIPKKESENIEKNKFFFIQTVIFLVIFIVASIFFFYIRKKRN